MPLGRSALRRLVPSWLALILGCGTEGLLAALYAAFGGVGPCGPTNDLSMLIMIVHMPGLSLASSIQNPWIGMAIILGLPAAIFSAVFYGGIKLHRGRDLVEPPAVRPSKAP